MVAEQAALIELVWAIASGDPASARQLLDADSELARARLEAGATREHPSEFFLDGIRHNMYAGDTALHIAGAAYDYATARLLVEFGAPLDARIRRKAQPLHYAADGSPGSARWDPTAQAETIAFFIVAGADPNATAAGGVTPLHRAVRTRSAAAVRALIDGGADPNLANANGSTPLTLARHTTGRSGSGSDVAKEQQAEIVALLESYGSAG